MPAAGSKAASSVAGHPCPGREASQAWDVFEMRGLKPWLPALAGLVWREEPGSTVMDSLAGLPDSHWLLRGKDRGELLTSGSAGKACLQMSKPSIIKKKKDPHTKTSRTKDAFLDGVQRKTGGMSSFN